MAGAEAAAKEGEMAVVEAVVKMGGGKAVGVMAVVLGEVKVEVKVGGQVALKVAKRAVDWGA